MRKVIICEKITDEILKASATLGIGEIATGVPRSFAKAVSAYVLPVVVVEGSNGECLLADALDKVTTKTLDAVVDVIPIRQPALEDRIAALEAKG